MTTSDDFTGDELASAYLDGEATPDEVALVESSPALLARVEALRVIARAVAAPVAPVDDDVREAALSTALIRAAGPVAAGAGSTSSLADARLARARRAQRWLPALAAAAAVVVVLAIGSAVVRGGGDGDMSAASRTSNDADAAAEGGEALEDSAGPVAPAVGADILGYTVLDGDLGSFDDLADLEAAVDERIDQRQAAEAASGAGSPTTTAPAGGGTDEQLRDGISCFGSVVDGDADLGAFRFAAPATYQATPVIVLVFDLTDGGGRVYIVDAASCAEVTRLDR